MINGGGVCQGLKPQKRSNMERWLRKVGGFNVCHLLGTEKERFTCKDNT
jgi:hypothetical protein